MLFVWMVLWHVYGKQNPSSLTYKTSTTEFAQLTEAYIKKNMIGVDKGIPVVRPEPNSHVFVMAEMWRWSPVLVLEVNQAYKFHISSKDVVHGFSIQPVNMNFQVYPTYDYVLEFKPTEVGEYKVICNEFCGIGHAGMIGKIVVIEKEADLRKYGYEKFKKAPVALSTEEMAKLSDVEKVNLGEQVYTLKGCGSCHTTDGSKLIGPTWKGLYGKKENVNEDGNIKAVLVDDTYIKESIHEPAKKKTVGFEKTLMPKVAMTDDELQYLTAYIKSLKD